MKPSRAWFRTIACVGLAGALACAGDEPDASASESASSSSGTGSTLGMSSTSGPATTGTASASSDSPSSATSETSAGETTGAPTGTLEDLEASCAAFCEQALACLKPSPYPDAASCVWLCLGTYTPELPTCTGAQAELNLCIAGLTCPDFVDALTGQGFGPCADAKATQDDACPAGCAKGLVDGGPTMCGIVEECPGEPTRAFECSGDLCTCLVDDVPQGECAADAICKETWEARALAANACCGFDF